MPTRNNDLAKIIDYTTAPLVQWEPAIGEEPSEGKRHEDTLTHSAILDALRKKNVQNITGIIADECRLEIFLAHNLPNVKTVTHLTLRGAFEKAAQHNLQMAVQNQSSLRSENVRVTTKTQAIKPGSQDAVVANMIFGCLATAQDHSNLHKMLCCVATLLKPEGQLVVVRPNPDGGAFSTYSCVTPKDMLKEGDDYEFIVKGLEDFGAMKNLYTPDGFLGNAMAQAGFVMEKTTPIEEKTDSGIKAPFLMNMCTLRR